MKVRAKFYVRAIEMFSEPRDSGIVKMTACTTGDENKSWSKWTPSGNIEMHINNPEAFKQFELGKEYFVEFTKIEPEAQS